MVGAGAGAAASAEVGQENGFGPGPGFDDDRPAETRDPLDVHLRQLVHRNQAVLQVPQPYVPHGHTRSVTTPSADD